MSTFHLEVSAQDFRSYLESVCFAADTENRRYALASVAMQYSGTVYTVVATDGRRLAWRRLIAPAQNESDNGMVLIDLKTVKSLLRRITEHAMGSITIDVDESRCITFSWLGHNRKRKTIKTQEQEGRFPSWHDLERTKEACSGKLVTTAESLRDILPELHTGYLFNLNGKRQFLTRENITLPGKYSGDNLTMSLDVELLRDWLSAVSSQDSKKNVDVELLFYSNKTDDMPVQCYSRFSNMLLMPLSKGGNR